MQRGCMSTLAASPKMARERSAGSEIAANAEGGCSVLEGCAEPEVDPTTQKSNVMAGPARMSPHFMEDNWGPRGQLPRGPALPFRAASIARASSRLARTGAPAFG